MARQCCTISSCVCGISLRDGALTIAVVMMCVSILRLVYAVTNVCHGRNEALFGALVEVINIPLAVMLLFGVLREKMELLCVWNWNTSVVAVAAFIYGCLLLVAIDNLPDGIASIAMAIVQLYFVLAVRSFRLSYRGGSEIIV